jgi:hypothetical protein
MPERLGRVTIALDHGNVTISWLGRQVLIGRLQHAPEIRKAFEAVGPTPPRRAHSRPCSRERRSRR